MKTTRTTILGAITVFALVIGCASTGTKSNVTGAHPQYEKMCSKCHTLDRVTIAHDVLSQEQMRAIVSRMSKKPGSGIHPNNIDDIIRELY